jgi:hypothetical protein
MESLIKQGIFKGEEAIASGIDTNSTAVAATNTIGTPAFLFELEDDGTVLYSRTGRMDLDGLTPADLEGRNFFEAFTGFEDLTAYRQHFKTFVNSRKAAASFVWRHRSPAGAVNAKVIMTRAFQSGYDHPKGVVMMEIKS